MSDIRSMDWILEKQAENAELKLQRKIEEGRQKIKSETLSAEISIISNHLTLVTVAACLSGIK